MNLRDPRLQKGLIALFVRHRNAANLLMIAMIVFGAYGISRLHTQFFPTTKIETISVGISWPGASAQDVARTVLAAVDPEVRFLDGVDEVNSYAREGHGTIIVGFKDRTDMQKAMADLEAAVSRITTLPESSEKPTFNHWAWTDRVARLDRKSVV